MWSAVKDPLDSPLTFDRDGLDLAFKYFTSSTLTMRLAGITQINSHINMFNELCNNESIIEVENVGQNLANWLIENQIISHIFGPNLHVEVCNHHAPWKKYTMDNLRIYADYFMLLVCT
jgi:ubiquitin carboxyl-terminal hydrolase 34